ncbi:hypothetical protein BH11PSE9_BH11PSE9_28340 [soil metagenome]
MKQMEVTILGQSYLLGCPENGEASLLEAVSSVDREMSAIRDGGKVKARERIAVLAALNLAFALAERPAARNAQTSAQTSAQTALGTETPMLAGEVDIDALISRIDQALGADGQLL